MVFMQKSLYRLSGYSTKTALVWVKNDIMISIDQGKPVILIPLELSAAFDTVDHNVLFSRLKDMFGLSGKVLEWFRSYLEQRFQRMSVHGILFWSLFYRVQFLVLLFSHYIPILLGSLRSDIWLNMACMLMTHN